MNPETKADPIDIIALRNDARAPISATADVRHYDDYFRIDRTDDPVAWWSGAQRVARLVIDDLPAAELDEDLQADLLGGVSRLLLAGGAVRAGGGAAVPAGPAEPPGDGTAARRWKLGHHLFHHMLSLMNSHTDGLGDALGDSDWIAVRLLLGELTALYDAATATMHYAAGFPATAYEAAVRPTMEPPWMPPGFSGVFNREHEVLLDRLATLKPRLRGRAAERGMPAETARTARALWKAQSRNRREHKLICEKFVPGGSSLLQQHFTEKKGR
ncbi:hypothetical protein [Amycolatopsis sp. PS_44_ISF1]|uniref:hypothetical protein n=1 Tax=Amycolatopsis sp. PS_44_ISF1 TaxID=2974917 RepID=UPI0028DED58D|nr:hypothetical protein [Amycolatopsis sp. PS_44_ISF1]MDT8912380.1 hypothetical protein [Amycolatopsis sp. PS_44_ISF1]